VRVLRLTVIGAAIVLSACTSPSHARKSSGTATGPSGGTLSSVPSSTSTHVVPAALLRTHEQTQIGDPVTADLCAAIDLPALPELGPGLRPSFDARQFPPGCSITVRDGTTSVVGLTVFARQGSGRTSTTFTTRVQDGQTIRVYAFDAKTGSCRRDIVATGVRLVVDAFAPGTQRPSERVACTGTDAVADRLAGAVARAELPRLSLAEPSVSELNACAVVQQTAIPTMSAFTDSKVVSRGYGANCELVHGTTRFLFVNFELAKGTRPPGATAVTVRGHRIYEIAAQPDYCAYTSVQGATAEGGRHERIAVSSTVVGSQAPPAQLCGQTAQALADYLTAAGLH
jgi:hypothetical protein